MSRQATFLDSRDHSQRHKIKVANKYQKLQMLKALLEEHEALHNPDHAYVLELRRKLRCAKHQLDAMLP